MNESSVKDLALNQKIDHLLDNHASELFAVAQSVVTLDGRPLGQVTEDQVNHGQLVPKLLDSISDNPDVIGKVMFILNSPLRKPSNSERINPRLRKEQARRRMLARKIGDHPPILMEPTRVLECPEEIQHPPETAQGITSKTAQGITSKSPANSASLVDPPLSMSPAFFVDSPEDFLENETSARFVCAGCGKSSLWDQVRRTVVVCDRNCRLDYHVRCWLMLHEELSRPVPCDSGVICPRLECHGLVAEVLIHLGDRVLRRETYDPPVADSPTGTTEAESLAPEDTSELTGSEDYIVTYIPGPVIPPKIPQIEREGVSESAVTPTESYRSIDVSEYRTAREGSQLRENRRLKETLKRQAKLERQRGRSRPTDLVVTTVTCPRTVKLEISHAEPDLSASSPTNPETTERDECPSQSIGLKASSPEWNPHTRSLIGDPTLDR